MASKRPAAEDDPNPGITAKRAKGHHDLQSLDDEISPAISRSRSPAIAHERRFFCPIAGCASGANDAAGLRKHLKTQHEDYQIPKTLDEFSVPWMSWVRGDHATHPPTGQAKTAYLEYMQAAQQPNPLIRLRLALKDVASPTPYTSDNEDAADSDATWQTSRTIAATTRIQQPISTPNASTHDIIFVKVPPTPVAPTAPSTRLQAVSTTQIDGLRPSRLRSSRNPSRLGSRITSRANPPRSRC